MAFLRDFVFTKYASPAADGAMGIAMFNIQGGDASWWDDEWDDENVHDDFQEALEEFKDGVPWTMRSWDATTRLWSVRITPSTRQVLRRIFDNADELFETAERQLALF